MAQTKKIPEDRPVRFRIISRAKPIIECNFGLKVFGFEYNTGFNSEYGVEYNVVDEDMDVYFIGNNPMQCEAWIMENTGSPPDYSSDYYE